MRAYECICVCACVVKMHTHGIALPSAPSYSIIYLFIKHVDSSIKVYNGITIEFDYCLFLFFLAVILFMQTEKNLCQFSFYRGKNREKIFIFFGAIFI